jgi:4-amino-4-deoxy-L-arabinose transferase-like glycosyltransferase
MAEREWREASDMRQSTGMFAAVIAIAAILRFWALSAGIPYALGVDEPELMDRALQMMRSGDFNPHFFHYPGFYIHLQLVVACLRFLAGATSGQWRSLDDVASDDFYLWGRALTALLGTLTVWLVYRIGTRWGARYALLAAMSLAVMPMHVRESHYVLTDVPVTFFVTLTFLLALRAHERERAGAFAWAGAAAGVAAATKYPGVLALVLPLAAVWMTPATHPSRIAGALATGGAAIAGFLIAAPYTVLDLPGFLNGYGHLAGYYAAKPPAEPAWLLYLKHLRLNLSWPALLLAGVGLVLGALRAARGPGRVRWILAVIFPLVYFWFISKQTLVFGRYLLPLVPFVCVLVSVAVLGGVSLLRRFDIPRSVRTALVAGLTVAALLPSAFRAIAFDRNLGRQSTVEQAYEWITKNVPRGSAVAIETRALLLSGDYRAANFPRLISDHLTREPRERAYYVSEGYDYLIASSQQFGPVFEAPQRHPKEYSAYMRLFEQSTEVIRFPPSEEHPGPELRVYKLR